MAKYNHSNYARRIGKMKNETLVCEYRSVCLNPSIKYKNARLRVLGEQMIQRFLEANSKEKL